MAQNNFIIDLIAGLKKTKSKKQIKTDIKALGDFYLKLIGNLDMPKTRKNIRNQLKGLSNNTFTITPTVNTKGGYKKQLDKRYQMLKRLRTVTRFTTHLM